MCACVVQRAKMSRSHGYHARTLPVKDPEVWGVRTTRAPALTLSKRALGARPSSGATATKAGIPNVAKKTWGALDAQGKNYGWQKDDGK